MIDRVHSPKAERSSVATTASSVRSLPSVPDYSHPPHQTHSDSRSGHPTCHRGSSPGTLPRPRPSDRIGSSGSPRHDPPPCRGRRASDRTDRAASSWLGARAPAEAAGVGAIRETARPSGRRCRSTSRAAADGSPSLDSVTASLSSYIPSGPDEVGRSADGPYVRPFRRPAMARLFDAFFRSSQSCFRSQIEVWNGMNQS